MAIQRAAALSASLLKLRFPPNPQPFPFRLHVPAKSLSTSALPNQYQRPPFQSDLRFYPQNPNPNQWNNNNLPPQNPNPNSNQWNRPPPQVPNPSSNQWNRPHLKALTLTRTASLSTKTLTSSVASSSPLPSTAVSLPGGLPLSRPLLCHLRRRRRALVIFSPLLVTAR